MHTRYFGSSFFPVRLVSNRQWWMHLHIRRTASLLAHYAICVYVMWTDFIFIIIVSVGLSRYLMGTLYLQRSAPFANFCFSVESCYAGETRSTWTFWMFVRMTPNTNNTDDAISERIWNFTRAMTPSIDSDKKKIDIWYNSHHSR